MDNSESFRLKWARHGSFAHIQRNLFDAGLGRRFSGDSLPPIGNR